MNLTSSDSQDSSKSGVYGIAAIIDDEVSQREDFERPLKRIGYQIVQKCHSYDDLKPDQKYGVILVDMMYDGQLLGPDYCARIRKDHEESIVIGISNHTDEAIKKSAEDSGAHAFLDKGSATTRAIKKIIKQFRGK